MRLDSALSLAAGFALLLPVAEAQALSRTVHVQTGATSADQVAEIFVRIDGPYINYDARYLPDPGDLQTLEVGQFVAVEGIIVEKAIKKDPGTCLTHLWVMPSIPAAERTELRMLMPSGFGESRFTFVADFNGDGRPDVASARDHKVRLVASEGAGVWSEQTFQLPAAKWGGGRYNYTWAVDLDGNGRADLLTASGIQLRAKLSHPRVTGEE